MISDEEYFNMDGKEYLEKSSGKKAFDSESSEESWNSKYEHSDLDKTYFYEHIEEVDDNDNEFRLKNLIYNF